MMKKGKIAIGIVASFIITALIATIVASLFNYNETRISKLTNENYEAAKVTLGKSTITVKNSLTWNKKEAEDTSFDVDGIQIVQQAAKLLGTKYGWGQKGGAISGKAENTATVVKSGIDCSGLAAWSLTSLGYEFNVKQLPNGNYAMGNKGYYPSSKVPVDTIHWITSSVKGSDSIKYYNEAGIYKEDEKNPGIWYFEMTYPRNNTSIYTAYTDYITCNKSNLEGNRINVLKVNDIITPNYRYYQYDLETDENGNVISSKELPMGTIVYSHNQGIANKEHIWIYIGDLGTDNAEEAGNKLVEMGIITEEQKQYVKKNGNSHHWRIESHGSGGVEITNIDPNTGSKDGTKETGTIWAFQVANDYKTATGEYTLNLAKRSASENIQTVEDLRVYTNCLSAKFNVEQFVEESNEKSNNTTELITKVGELTNVNIIGNNGVVDITNNYGKYDKYIIEEKESPANYNLPAVKKFELRVYKTVDVKENRYKISKVELYNVENGNKIGEASIDGEKFVISSENNVAIDIQENAINVTIIDPEKEGNYSVEIEKLDSKTRNAVPNITFKGTINGDYFEKTTDANGKVSLYSAPITINDYSNIDKFVIGEESNGKYAVLDGNIELYVQKAEQGTSFAVTGISDTEGNFRSAVEYNVNDTDGNSIECKAELHNGMISLTLTNTPYTPPTIKLMKVAGDDNEKFLLNTKFTLKRLVYKGDVLQGEPQVLTGTLNQIVANNPDKFKDEYGTISYTETEVGDEDLSFGYIICEDEAENGYINLFKNKYCIKFGFDFIDGLIIGGCDVKLIEEREPTDEELSDIVEIRNNMKFIIDQPRSEIQIEITNPKITKDVEVKLVKHVLNDKQTKVSGARYSIKKVTASGALIENLPGFTTNAEEKLIDEIRQGELGKSYYYEVTEEVVPNNYVSAIKSVRLQVSIDTEGNISAVPVKVMKKQDNEEAETWENYNEAEDAKYVSAIAVNNKVVLYMANSVQYKLDLYKKKFNSTTEVKNAGAFDGEAEFEIIEMLRSELDDEEETLPFSYRPRFNGTLTNAHTFLEESDRMPNRTYRYLITEKSVSDGYHNTLVDKTIILTIRTDRDGNVKSEKVSGGSEWEFAPSLGLTDAEKDKLAKFVQLEVINNQVNLYIANMPKSDYTVQLVKVDNKGNVIEKYQATFDYSMETNSTEQGFNEQVNVPNKNGYLNLVDENANNPIIEPEFEHTYRIKENTAPAGYIKLPGSIVLKVPFTAEGAISNANVSLKYFDEDNTEVALPAGLRVEPNDDVPLINIYIPNDSKLFEFELIKEDKNGNKIEGSELANGNWNGAEFLVTRVHTGVLSGQVTNAPNEDFFQLKDIFNGVLKTGNMIDKSIPAYNNLLYVYTINETATKAGEGLINILDGYQLILNIKTDNNSVVTDADYTVINTKNPAENPSTTTNNFKAVYGDFVTTEITTVDGTQRVILHVKNPMGYKVRLNKVDVNNNPIEARIEAYINENPESGNRNYINSDNRKCALNGTYVVPGTTNNHYQVTGEVTHLSEEFTVPNGKSVWTIIEHAAYGNYYNVFENKYIDVEVELNAENKPTVTGYKIVDVTTNTEVSAEEYTNLNRFISSIEFIEETINNEKVQVLNVTLKNPSKLKLNVTKYESDGVTELSGATITVNGEEIISNGESKGSAEAILYDRNQAVTWTIEETNTTQYHMNLLENYKIVVNATMSRNIYENKDFILSYFSIVDKVSNKQVPMTNKIYNYVDVNIVTDENDNEIVNVKILNPIEFEFEVNKVNMANVAMANVGFDIVSPIIKSQRKMFLITALNSGVEHCNPSGVVKGKTTEEGRIFFKEELVEVGKEYEYKITETYVSSNAFDVIKGDIFVKVIVDNNGRISIGTYENGKKFVIKNANGNVITEYDSLIKDVRVDLVLDVAEAKLKQVVKVVVQDTVKYDIKIHKKLFGYEEEDLAGRDFKIKNANTGRVQTITTDSKGLINFEESEMAPGTYRYIITEENNSNDNAIINTLQDKAIVLDVEVSANGEITIVKENADDTTNGLYIYNYANDTLGQKVEVNNKIYDLANVTYNENHIELTIDNPQEYEVILYKNDKSANEALNGIKFKATVFDDKGNEIKLKDSRTFEVKNLDNVVTENVMGSDGIIRIQNILFEKTGTYKIKLEELNAPSKYKTIGDIELEINIVIEKGRYVVKSINVISGNYFVDKKNTKIAKNHKEDIVFIKIDNEQIKGSYPLDFKKINGKLEEIEGAKVKVTALKDGKEITLYKEDGNVKSKNAVIPGVFEIKQGNIEVPSIRIEEAGSYILRIEEIQEPEKYVGLEKPVDIKITTSLAGTGKDQFYTLDTAEIISGNEKGLVKVETETSSWFITIKNRQFDLALRKYITAINHNGVNAEVTGREPVVDVTPLKEKTDTTAIYNHTKEPIGLYVNDIVTYTLRLYNEGDISGYAEVVTDHLPEYLEFVDNDFNKSFGWTLDESDKTGKTVKTDYLSRAKNAKDNLINAYDGVSDKLDSKTVLIQCKVKEGTPVETKVTNIAEISKFVDENGKQVTDRDSEGGNAKVPNGKDLEEYKDKEISSQIKYIPGQQDDDDFEKVFVKEFDLALRKFITGVTNGRGEKTEVTSRIPVFKVDEEGNYVYNHTKEPVLVANQNIVEYTIRVYNEGTVNGYAKEVKDDIPEGLEFLPDDSLNKEYRWIMLDEKGNETDKVNEAKYIVTDYLSMENETEPGKNLLKAFDKAAYDAGAIKEPDYRDLKVAFKVTIPNTSDEIIENKAQISDDSDEFGNEVTDKDSTPDKWIEGEDDQDIEKIKVLCFDLSLRKWVTKAIVTENGKTVITETGHKAEDNPEATVKVDLKKSKIKDVVVKFEYKIRVKNDREIDGYVQEITDYIPEGLKFVPEDNPDWKEAGEGKVTTDKLKDTLLKHGETAEVSIILTWINREDNMGLKVNVAEISKDYNEFGSPDIDSVPNNKVPGEDDIDDAPVMLTVKTGQTAIYVGIACMVLAIISTGVVLIKKYVI